LERRCRLLPLQSADGPHNMAADETLLESAAAGRASLRFYTWSEATVSLGYFQPDEPRRQDTVLAALPFVRRPSGGDALVHHHELTYALAVPAEREWQTCMCQMHHIIADALREWNIAVELCAAERLLASPTFLCFRHLTPGDVLLGPAKIVGSAQRRRRGLLQHGAILLAASPFAPVLPGIRELSDTLVPPNGLAPGAGRVDRGRVGPHG
jgi:lipoyl(octanoyl) transferase